MPPILKKFGAEKSVRWALALACMALVFWIRTVPLSLPVTDEQAETIVRANLYQRLSHIIHEIAPDEDSKAHLDGAVAEWIRRHPAEFESAKAAVAEQVRAEATFEGKDGRRYVHLSDYDSYVWLRNVRNYLRHGTTCDAIVNGECRDTFGNAPVGYRMRYNRSLHIAAIVATHRVFTFFRPGYPLSASAFFVPVLIGTLGVLPIFFLAYRVGGAVAGVVASVLACLHPEFLYRSLGSDNDVWNVVLPAFVAWSAVSALSVQKKISAMALAAAAGLLTGLHAAVWSGWLFIYAVILFGTLGYLTIMSAAGAHWRRKSEMGKTALVAAVYYFSAGCFTWLAGADRAFSIPLGFLHRMTRFSVQGEGQAGAMADGWPQALSIVAELTKPDSRYVVGLMGGDVYFFAAWMGLWLLLVRSRLRKRHLILTACGAALYVCYYFFAGRDPRWAVLPFFLAPPAFELAAQWLEKSETDSAARASALILIVWFIAALAAVFQGVRFVLLFGAPFGVAIGLTAGHIQGWAKGRLLRVAPRYPWIAGIAALIVIVAFSAQPIMRAYAAVHNYTPAMSRPWWEALSKIRDESRPDAIVHAWWDYGYWVKYVAERRTTSDGGSLQTHVPHWLAKALLAPSDAETVGILRMLDCGSDATPLPEGERGAHGKLVAMGRDSVAAYTLLAEVIKLPSGEARRFLAARGFTRAQQDDVLASTHCRPPEAFLIVNRGMLTERVRWIWLGSWDVKRAYLALRTRTLPAAEAVPDLVRRFGYSDSAAAEIYRQVSLLSSAGDRNKFIAPPQRPIPSDWAPCRRAGSGPIMTCRVAMRYADGTTNSMDFSYDATAPKRGSLRYEDRRGAPGVLIVAGARLEEVAAPSAEFSDLGVLLDVSGARVLVGAPLLIRSTLVRLIYLGGRYDAPFKSFDRRATLAGDEITIWKINWPDG